MRGGEAAKPENPRIGKAAELWGMEKQKSFKHVATEKQKSFKHVALEKQKSFKHVAMEKQKSFRNCSMEKQQSFQERRIKESPGKRGDTVLHIAARAGNSVHVERILFGYSGIQLKDLISKQNQDGESALYVASEKGSIEVVREILKVVDAQSAAIKAKNSFDAFHIAAKRGHLAVLKELLQAFPSLAMTTSTANATALDTAATQGHLDIVDLLLETDGSLTKIARNNGKTVLHSASRMGHVEVVRSLLSKDPSIGFRTDKKGQTAFHMAVKGSNVEAVLELLKPDPSIVNFEDSKGNTSMHIATRKGRTEIVQTLMSVEGIDINAANIAGETALAIAEKSNHEEIAAILTEAGAVVSVEGDRNCVNQAKQLKKTVNDIKHDVQSQLMQTQQTEVRVQSIRKRIQKLYVGGLNNAINSNTVVAVLIATVAFAAIFTMPGQNVQDPTEGFTLGEANIANNPSFILFLVFDSLALFISLAVVVVQTSLIVVEQKAKKLLVFVINKLMWLACLFISISFVALTYIVVGRHDWWLAWCTMAAGALIMLTAIGSMCYCIVVQRMEEKSARNIRRALGSRSRSWSLSVPSDSELLNNEHKTMYAL